VSKFDSLGSFKGARKGKASKDKTNIGRPSGRVRAKRGDKAYTPVSGFMLTELHTPLKAALVEMNAGKHGDDKTDFSDLLNEWARNWLQSRKSVKS
jgi:hypothetical protein